MANSRHAADHKRVQRSAAWHSVCCSFSCRLINWRGERKKRDIANYAAGLLSYEVQEGAGRGEQDEEGAQCHQRLIGIKVGTKLSLVCCCCYSCQLAMNCPLYGCVPSGCDTPCCPNG